MQLEIVTQCPACGNTSFEQHLTCTDYTSSKEDFQVQKCNGCGLLITNPRPAAKDIGSYYQSDEYISHTGKATNLFQWLYLRVRNYTLTWKHQLIKNKKAGGLLLDYGCGTGEFIDKMNQKGWRSYGVEPAEIARQQAHQLNKSGTGEIVERLNQLDGKKFDVITLWHVLEHVHEPNELLTQLKASLQSDGLIIVAVPNYESFDAQHYRQHWAAYDVPRHLWHFSKTSMKKLMNKNQLQVSEVVPMKLDAYYVSLLSEKYKSLPKTKLSSPTTAALIGFRSNINAHADMNFSSLIYIARHA